MNPILSLILLNPSIQTSNADWVTTEHSAHIGSDQLAYEATAGLMPLTDEKGDVKANLFFTAYVSKKQPNRPITFAWNGGPGGSSVLLHMYCMGPRMLAADAKDSKKFTVVDNPNSLLPVTDLVFIDPVGTGFSRAVKEDPKSYWGVEGDVKATLAFIQKYLDVTKRKTSSVYLAGESYGTFRAAGLALPALKADVNVKGLVLLSNAIRFDTMRGNPDVDLPFQSFLPTLTATAVYYKKLKPAYNAHPDKAIADAKAFASGDYLLALAQGDRISPSESHRIAQRVSELTSLPVDYIESKNLRIDPDDFRFKILHAEGKRLGKFSSTDPEDFSPDSSAAMAEFGTYLREELGFKSQEKYFALNLGANVVWNWGSGLFGPPDQSVNLKNAMERYPSLKLFVAQGLYDMTTPFYGEEYSFQHLGLAATVRNHWEFHTYQGGHMMYLVPSEHVKLTNDIATFVTSTSNSKG